MSRTKGVEVFERLVWVWDNSHDVVLARMIEATQAVSGIDREVIDDWRTWASVPDLGLTIRRCSPSHVTVLLDVVSRARTAIEAHGDVVATELRHWSVLDGTWVSGGFLRVDPLPVSALLDTIDGIESMLTEALEPDPPGAFWLLGAPDGRSVVPKRVD